ncbi:hypothetical protein CLM62_27290 [Streptomyces sp. SA15]|uniref:hypothetical protein n=1 Tax=Streptomyces sp. SA15 TaxID=934019 RepID=UPI000BAFAF7A|nr:hypothetical protein [Streptomyces sp. SA15]PAZ12935.1 hypothetical protein CLM62_27290 [Streptomyces sp. SA15]
MTAVTVLVAPTLAVALAGGSPAFAADVAPLEESSFCQEGALEVADGVQAEEKSCVSLEIGELPSVDTTVSAPIR